MICKHCGAEIADTANFCTTCGQAVSVLTSAEEPKMQANIPAASVASESATGKKSCKKAKRFRPKWLIVIMGISLFILIGVLLYNSNDTKKGSNNDYSNRKHTVHTDYPDAVLYSKYGDITVEDAIDELIARYENDVWGADSLRILKFGTVTSAELDFEYTGIDTMYAIFHIEISDQEDDNLYLYEANVKYLQEGYYGEYTYKLLSCGLGPKKV